MDLSSFGHVSIIEEEFVGVVVVKNSPLLIIKTTKTIYFLFLHLHHEEVSFDRIYIHLYFEMMMLTLVPICLSSSVVIK